MKKNNNITENWRERAISFLLKNTKSFREAIEHFVDCHWITDLSEEENLDNFEMYQSDLVGVFTY